MKETRESKARQLVKRLERGPEFALDPNWNDESSRLYRIWADSWILDDLKELLAKDLKVSR